MVYARDDDNDCSDAIDINLNAEEQLRSEE